MDDDEGFTQPTRSSAGISRHSIPTEALEREDPRSTLRRGRAAERGGDIELLAPQFLDSFNRQEGTRKTFAPAAVAELYSRSWPGNVRELKNYVQRMCILADNIVDVEMVRQPMTIAPDSKVIRVPVGTTLDALERQLIEATLSECASKREAARTLGVSLKTLYNRLVEYGTQRTDSEREA